MPVDRDPDDVDPTGIRDLLAGLPDPGPMPEHLVRRIEARLEVEEAARLHGSSHPLGRHADRVVDLATERSRRRPGRTLVWLGAAAAGLVVTAAVAPQLMDGMSGGDAGTAAHYPPREQADTMSGADTDADADADDAGGAEGGQAETPSLSSADRDVEAEGDSFGDEGADGSAGREVPLLPLDGELVLLPEQGLVEHEEMTQVLVLAVDEQDASPTRPPVLSGVLTEGEATSCWRGLSTTHSFDRYAAARARFVLEDGQRQGDPVVTLLGMHDDGSARSWVMPQGCTQDPDLRPILEGPARP